MHSCKKYTNHFLKYLIVFLILYPSNTLLASVQCKKVFNSPSKPFSLSPLINSDFSTDLYSLTDKKEVETAFAEIKKFMYKDGELTRQYLDLKDSLVKKSIIPLKTNEKKYQLYREDGEVDKFSYLKAFKQLEEAIKELHPDKVKTVADLLTISKAFNQNDKIDYKDAEALEDLYRKVETNMDAMRGKPKAKVNPSKIFKDAKDFLKGKDSFAYTIKVLIGGALVDGLAVIMFRYLEMSPSEAFWQSEMLFYFAQSYVSFQVMQMLVNPVYTNSRLTHRQSFVKTYATSVALYATLVPTFRFLHDQFLGGSSIPVSPMMMGTYFVSMMFYALAWKVPNELIFRKIISPIFFDHFLSETEYQEILDVKHNSKNDLIEKYKQEANFVSEKLSMIQSINSVYHDVFKGNMNGNYQKTYDKLINHIIHESNSKNNESEWNQVLEDNFGITKEHPRVKHPEVIERDIFALQNQLKGIHEKIRWTNFFRKGLRPGEPVKKRKIAFYLAYEQMGRVFTASVMISAFIVGQKMLVGDSMFTLDGLFSQILTHMSGIYEAFSSASFGN